MDISNDHIILNHKMQFTGMENLKTPPPKPQRGILRPQNPVMVPKEELSITPIISRRKFASVEQPRMF